jgi:hypothetical protein
MKFFTVTVFTKSGREFQATTSEDNFRTLMDVLHDVERWRSENDDFFHLDDYMVIPGNFGDSWVAERMKYQFVLINVDDISAVEVDGMREAQLKVAD